MSATTKWQAWFFIAGCIAITLWSKEGAVIFSVIAAILIFSSYNDMMEIPEEKRRSDWYVAALFARGVMLAGVLGIAYLGYKVARRFLW